MPVGLSRPPAAWGSRCAASASAPRASRARQWPRTLLVILDPSAPLSGTGPSRHPPLSPHRRPAARRASAPIALMRCFGYRVEPQLFDSLASAGDSAVRCAPSCQPTGEKVSWPTRVAPSTPAPSRCVVPTYRARDAAAHHRKGLVAVRLEPADSWRQHRAGRRCRGSSAIGRCDATTTAPARSRSGWSTASYDRGPLRGVSPRLRRRRFARRRRRSAWSWRSPWGWAVWQLAAVGLLALLLVGAVRFGPVMPAHRSAPTRSRSSICAHSPTALSAAKGHDEAIGAIVRGLRRRLTPPALRARGDWRRWLVELDGTPRRPGTSRHSHTLTQLTDAGATGSERACSGQRSGGVWQNIRT